MDFYNFPKDLYVRLDEIPKRGLKAEIYRRIEYKEGELAHMKRVGLIWLKNSKDSGELEQRLRDETSWDAHS